MVSALVPESSACRSGVCRLCFFCPSTVGWFVDGEQLYVYIYILYIYIHIHV